ncbi:MBL fold metallo-hydrolase [Christiangramia fulva]|uniref:MBL fold metallo-hydrolase n=1 Tax=Christiangramia fulva TaxID=2126553 RepID=A0A2R3ZAB4_9FLAO|nr:MBL fold metallo-hydrolase [Christiangramia fulva]AVR47225.1 MBL fold metallo-hydrolase [Christiangramia fulva]
MKLKVVATGSKGNCYLLQGEKETLMIECGVNIREIKKALHFDFSKLSAVLVTHEHKDHAECIEDLTRLGVNVYATAGTFGSFKSNRAKEVVAHNTFFVGGFKIMAFDVKHDAKDPVGYLIQHPECGKVLFLTDTFYCPYTFRNLNNILIETNFSKAIIKEKLSEMEFLKNRIYQSHMSLETAVEMLQANDLSKVNNIVLIHLSDSNSDERIFKETVHRATGKNVSVANNGMELEFNKTPF